MQLGEIAADQHSSVSLKRSSARSAVSWTYMHHNVDVRKILLSLMAIALSGLCAVLLFHNSLAGIATALLLFCSISDRILPLRYRLDHEYVSVKLGFIEWLEMPWSDVKSVYKTRDGLKLSVFPVPTAARFESLRGITVKYPDEMSEQVEQFVAERTTKS